MKHECISNVGVEVEIEDLVIEVHFRQEKRLLVLRQVRCSFRREISRLHNI